MSHLPALKHAIDEETVAGVWLHSHSGYLLTLQSLRNSAAGADGGTGHSILFNRPLPVDGLRVLVWRFVF